MAEVEAMNPQMKAEEAKVIDPQITRITQIERPETRAFFKSTESAESVDKEEERDPQITRITQIEGASGAS